MNYAFYRVKNKARRELELIENKISDLENHKKQIENQEEEETKEVIESKIEVQNGKEESIKEEIIKEEISKDESDKIEVDKLYDSRKLAMNQDREESMSNQKDGKSKIFNSIKNLVILLSSQTLKKGSLVNGDISLKTRE